MARRPRLLAPLQWRRGRPASPLLPHRQHKTLTPPPTTIPNSLAPCCCFVFRMPRSTGSWGSRRTELSTRCVPPACSRDARNAAFFFFSLFSISISCCGWVSAHAWHVGRMTRLGCCGCRKGRVEWKTSAPSPLMGAEGSARTSCSSACRALRGSGRSYSRSRSSCVRRPSRTRRSSRRNKASRLLPRSMPQLWQRSRLFLLL